MSTRGESATLTRLDRREESDPTMARREPDPPHDHDPLKGGLKHNPFAALKPKSADSTSESAKSTEPSVTRADSTPRSAPSEPRAAHSTPRVAPSGERVTVRRERSGRGGKTVTIAEGPGLAGRDLETLASEIRRGLGAGARVEEGTIVVQGEQPDRLVAWLVAHGFASVGRGN